MKKLMYFCERCRQEIQDEKPVKINPVYILRSLDEEKEDGEVFKIQKERHYCMDCTMAIMEYAETEPKPEPDKTIQKERLEKFQEILESVDAGHKEKETKTGRPEEAEKRNRRKAKATAGIRRKVMVMFLDGKDYEQIKKSTGLSVEQIEKILEELEPE